MYKNEVTAEELVLEVRFKYFINNNEDPIRIKLQGHDFYYKEPWPLRGTL